MYIENVARFLSFLLLFLKNGNRTTNNEKRVLCTFLRHSRIVLRSSIKALRFTHASHSLCSYTSCTHHNSWKKCESFYSNFAETHSNAKHCLYSLWHAEHKAWEANHNLTYLISLKGSRGVSRLSFMPIGPKQTDICTNFKYDTE